MGMIFSWVVAGFVMVSHWKVYKIDKRTKRMEEILKRHAL